MKTKVTDVTYTSDHVYTVVELTTPIGRFYGKSTFNEDKDPLKPSAILGGRIAEDRAYIEFYNQLMINKRIELKGIKRLLDSSNPDKSGYNHIKKMYDVISHELEDLKTMKQFYQRDIKEAVDGRRLFVQSRTEDKETKKQKLDQLGSAIKALGQTNSKE